MAFHVPEKDRLTEGMYRSEPSYGNNGAFLVRVQFCNLWIIASDSADFQIGDHRWEHVSVSVQGSKRTPSWKEMCAVKDIFWDDEDVVVQFHPKKSEYVNNCGSCLHLWRLRDEEFPTPHSLLVGVKEAAM